MSIYSFESTDFALSDKGIHLLRSGYNYKTIEYNMVDKATIKRGAEINNVNLCLVIGICLFGFAIMQTRLVINLFNDPSVTKIYIESIVLPVLPGLVGIYFVYIAVKKGIVLIIETGSKEYKLRLRDFIKDNTKEKVIKYLTEKLSYKISLQDG